MEDRGRVEALYAFESESATGKRVNVQPGETFALIDDRDALWLFVAKNDSREGFYLPRNYVSELDHNVRPSAGDRRSAFLASDTGSLSGVRKTSQSKGFKIADPRLAAKSIPADLNFVHNIPDLAKFQEWFPVLDRRRDDGSPTRPVAAVPRPVSTALLPPSFSRSPPEAPPPPPDEPPDARKEEEKENDDTYEHIANGSSGEPKAQDREYQNLHDYWNTEAAPTPRDGQGPVRSMDDGWAEYVDSVGRTFYFNAELSAATWKPPRAMRSPAAVAQLLESSASDEKYEESGYSSSHMTGSNESSGPSITTYASVPPRSLRLANKGYGLPPPPSATTPNSDYEHSAELASLVGDDAGSPTPAPPPPSAIHATHTIKSGTVDHARYIIQGKKVKKLWSSVYIFLTSAHIIIYKDEQASKKKGAHYSAPLGVNDLRGGRIEWKKEKEGRKKHIFVIELMNGDVNLWSCPEECEANSWFNEIRKVMSVLPYPEPYPSPEVGLSRRPSGGWRAGSLRVLPTPVSASPPPSPTKLKEKRKSGSMSNSMVDESPLPESRASILEKLRKLFRSRPSIDTLREKGIYKAEPVFGSSLMEICKREAGTVPKFVRVCAATIEAKGLEADGLYRISGNLSQIQKIRCQVDQDSYGLLEGEEDIHVLSGALKLFFRELQEPLFPLTLTKDFMTAIKVQNAKARLKSFQELLRRLPPPHADTLRLLLAHLIRVAELAARNRMQIHNLAIVFGPSLFSAGHKAPVPVKAKDKKRKPKTPAPPEDPVFSSNSHLAFNMIMQGQIVEYLLKEFPRLYT